MKRFALLVGLAGCAIGPNYQTPEVCLPGYFQEMPDEVAETDLSKWWKQFEDEKLDELIDEALCCNYDFRIALERIEEVRAQYRIAQSVLYPQIAGNMVALRARRSENLGSDVIETSNTASDIVATDFSGPLIQWFYQTEIDASWEIDIWGKNRRRAEAALHDLEATQEGALDIQITLVSDVATSYIDIRSVQQRLDAKRDQISRQKELLELAKARYIAGLTSYLDVTRAQSSLDAQVSTLPPLEESLKQEIHGLAILLGRQPENFTVGEGYIPKGVNRIPPNLPSTLLLRRPDIRQADRELAATTSRIGVAWGEILPSFSLTGSFGTQTNAFDKLFVWPSRFWTIGPEMIWNLFQGGRLISQIKVANQIQKQALLNYENIINRALRDVEDRLVGYGKEQSRLHALEEQLGANSLTRDLSLEQYLAGLISLDDVLEAESDLFTTQESMIESEGTMMIQLVGLYKALGGGWQCSNSL